MPPDVPGTARHRPENSGSSTSFVRTGRRWRLRAWRSSVKRWPTSSSRGRSSWSSTTSCSPRNCRDGWPAFVVERLGDDRFAILNFALGAVIVIALVGAVSAYAEKYLTTSVGPVGRPRPPAAALPANSKAVVARARRIANGRSDQPRHERYRRHPGVHQHGTARHRRQRADAGRHDWRDVLHQLALHADRLVGRAGPLRGRLLLYTEDQEGVTRRSEDRKASCCRASRKC